MKKLFLLLTLLSAPGAYGMEQKDVALVTGQSLDSQLLGAAKSGDREKVKQLCALEDAQEKKCITINLRDDEWGATPLHWATEGGHKDVALVLLQHGADKESRDCRYNATPLHWAIHNGDLGMVMFFVEQEANLNALNKFQDTPLHIAAFCGKSAIVQFLIEQCKADINAGMVSGCTPLHYAAYKGHLEIVEYLVKRGAAIKAPNRWQQTPWMHAQRRGHNHILDFIRQHVIQEQPNFQCPVCFDDKQSHEAALTDYGCLSLICCGCKAILQARGDSCPLCRRSFD